MASDGETLGAVLRLAGTGCIHRLSVTERGVHAASTTAERRGWEGSDARPDAIAEAG
jgi:hypothetical protein